MNIKKIAIMASFVTALAYANFASAVAWSPLVRIPGLPATGTVNLSMYMIGLYNFLLSIVGIVAVMMLIIGGMRYITAAGNAAAISDAKDIIQNAVVGLIIALFSWVFIATINPDALYIKQPGASFLTTTVHGVCYQSFDSVSSAPGACVCIDGTTAPIVPDQADAEACEVACQSYCNLSNSSLSSCIAPGSPFKFTSSDFTDEDSPYYGLCKCIDNAFVTPNWMSLGGSIPDPPATTLITCNDVCSDRTLAADIKYHGIKWDLRVGENLGNLVSADGITLPLGVDIYHDLSQIKDCTGRGVHITIDYDGGPLWLLVPDRWCCFEENSPAGLCGGWANICNLIYPECHDTPETDIYPPPNDGKDYPIWKHSYGVAGLQKVWVGASHKDAAGICWDVAHIFDLDIK